MDRINFRSSVTQLCVTLLFYLVTFTYYSEYSENVIYGDDHVACRELCHKNHVVRLRARVKSKQL